MSVRGDTRAGICGILAFSLGAAFASIGSLLIPPLVSLLALVSFTPDRAFWRLRPVPWALVGAVGFLAWMALSFTWSPYEKPAVLYKVGLGVPLYILFVMRMNALSPRWRHRVEAVMMFFVVGLGLFLLAESLLDGQLTRSAKLLDSYFDGRPERVLTEFTNRNLGHAAVPLILMSLPCALLAWRQGSNVLPVIIMALAGLAAFSFSTETNAVAFLAATVAAGLVYVWPRAVIAILFGLLAGLVLAVPVIMDDLIAMFPESWREMIPASWKYRLEIWEFVSTLIEQRPIIGYGVEASRVLNSELALVIGDTTFNVEALPLHPHNATLQVWLETGAIGAMLLAFTLVTLGGRIASSRRLSRLQAVGAIWVFVVYASQIVFSYGLWQEWHQGTLALAVIPVLFLGASKGSA
ncbi:O-antigen ligase family protein [Maricaulis sp. CAU 1757]